MAYVLLPRPLFDFIADLNQPSEQRITDGTRAFNANRNVNKRTVNARQIQRKRP